jgi:RNA polymerase sigma-70 factor (ECF subfamily)|tara:strand:+ start:1512 stop:2090 length:579 start_codon:yes stop_codon:yes gene_type:complete
MPDNITDKEIIERVKNGDKKAYDLLVLKYQQRVINLISRFVKNHADALDVSQETFIKAYKALPNFRGESAFYTWLYRIAVNTAKNHLTVQSRKITKSDYDVTEIEQIEGNMTLTEQTTPENLLIKDELQDIVLNTIENLPEDLKSAIMLREIEGLSYEEIAAVMECPVGTVRSRIFRARETIDNKIKPLLKN